MNCKKCGSRLDDGAIFCTNCGEKIMHVEKVDTENLSGNNKNNIIKVIFIIIFIAGLILSFCLGFFVGKREKGQNDVVKENKKSSELKTKGKEDNISSNEEYTFNLYDTNMKKEVKDDKDLSKNITINKVFFNPNSKTGKYRDAYVYGKNNNANAVKVRVEVEYYDAEGYRINSDATEEIVYGGSFFVFGINVRDDSIQYKTLKLLYSAKKVESYYTVIDINKIEIKDTMLNEGNINVTIKNHSDVESKINHIACVYYKDGKEVFASGGYVSGDIKPGEVGLGTIYEGNLYLKAYDKSKKIEYDNYKVFVYSAYDYDSENYQ